MNTKSILERADYILNRYPSEEWLPIAETIRDMRDYIAGMGGWQPIENAPKDRDLLLYDLGVTEGKWHDYDYSNIELKVRPSQKYTGWLDNDANIINPTHWQSLLPKPENNDGR